ncbi:MAG: type II 3-dehydroquinate dehydratase [Actinobacteria bacterium]|jgi:3-dehydroquinate dehydratase II|uniref:3-dehydroquinate dehydratase n=1 Tax=freshwater metagenome TaxID=449393 RepID=A0A6J6N9R5_9ZZZZ|nr:type II 3-dehydroquinate dehydratase [Actinomycetota bacterium]
MSKVLVLNGPNLSRLGAREPEIYGNASWADLVSLVENTAAKLNLAAEVRQTDSESELIGWIHEAIDSSSDVVINPAAFTHYSYALRDACAMLTKAKLRLIEVHISNPHAREEFRHTSVISGVATGVIAGFGIDSYALALQQLAKS